MGNLIGLLLPVVFTVTFLSSGYCQNVGIGTTSPASKLDVSGGITIGTSYAGINTAPANGALIEGNVGIGTTIPSVALDVNGQIRMRTGAVNGYIPVADGNGVMTWTDPATLIGGDFWGTTGNAGTNPSSNYLGTSDAQDLVFRTDNTEKMRIKLSGNVYMGGGFDDSRLSVFINNTNLSNYNGLLVNHDGGNTSLPTYGIKNYNLSSTDTSKYGLYSFVNNDGLGARFGVYNQVNINSASTASAHGIRNIVNALNGSGIHYGQWNTLNLGSSNTSDAYGEYTYVDLSSGTRYGEYKEMYSNSGSGGDMYGDYNYLSGSGNGANYGVYNDMAATGTGIKVGVQNEFIDVPGTKYGVRNIISSTVPSGSMYGVYNYIVNDGTGSKYGSYNWVDGGGASLFGCYNYMTPVPSNTNNVFGLYSLILPIGGGTHYGIYSNVAGGANAYAAMFNAGHVVANESGGDYDFRIEGDNKTHLFFADASTDRIGIGNSAPLFDLHVGDGTLAAINTADTRVVSSNNANQNRAAFLALARDPVGNRIEAQFEADGQFNDAIIFGAATSHPVHFRTGNITRMSLSTTGSLGIGTAAPATTLHVNHPSGTTNGLSISNQFDADRWHFYVFSTNDLYLYFNNAARGSFNSVSGAYTQLSDARLKTDIQLANSVLKRVTDMPVYSYSFKHDADHKQYMGVLAQEAVNYFPELVNQTSSTGGEVQDLFTVDYAGFSMVAIKAIQEQQILIESLQSQLTALQKQIEGK